MPLIVVKVVHSPLGSTLEIHIKSKNNAQPLAHKPSYWHLF